MSITNNTILPALELFRSMEQKVALNPQYNNTRLVANPSNYLPEEIWCMRASSEVGKDKKGWRGPAQSALGMERGFYHSLSSILINNTIGKNKILMIEYSKKVPSPATIEF